MFERSSAVAHGTDIPKLTTEHFRQYSGDNVDHNVRGLDGKGTFHGMGIIAVVTPGELIRELTRTIPTVPVARNDIVSVGKINTRHFLSDRDSLHSLYYHTLKDPSLKDLSMDLDILWKSSLLLNVTRPQWSGFAYLVQKGEYPGVSSVTFLPIIDVDPNDLSCFYSTLKCISSHARQYQT